jgi:NTE family protein
VLGAGGVVGASWLVGALEALEAETGWSPSSAEVVVGTSAGSVIGALAAHGVPPALMAAHILGDPLDGLAELEEREPGVLARVTGTDYRLHRGLPPLGPGSWRMGLTTLLNPRRHAPSALLCGWLPRGVVATAPISELVEQFVGAEWPAQTAFWAMACDYATGRRVAFGRPGAPVARVGDAVAASCAIPGFYHPVSIGSRRYVDGGVCSGSNLDVLAHAGLDLVVCLNPMSSQARMTPRTAGDHVAAAMRRAAGKRLEHEAAKLRARGTEVLLLEPTADDLAVMGANYMARHRREQVLERARRTTAMRLRRLRARPGTVLPPRTRPRPAAVPPDAIDEAA